MVRTVLFWLATVPATAFFSSVSIVGGLIRAPARLHDWVHRNWSRTLLWAAGVRVTVDGLERVDRESPQILVANHQSIFDVFALLASLPVSIRFVAKQELGRIPVFASAMRAAGHVFIDRGDRRKASEAMRGAAKRMKRERLSLGLFPEGTRSRDGRLRDFKKGTFVLAIETQLPILPVGVQGGHRVVVARRIRSGAMRIAIGEPLDTFGLGAEDRDRVLESVRGSIQRLLSASDAQRAEKGV